MHFSKHCKGCRCVNCRWQGGDNCPYGYCWKCDGQRDVAYQYAATASWCRYYGEKYDPEKEAAK